MRSALTSILLLAAACTSATPGPSTPSSTPTATSTPATHTPPAIRTGACSVGTLLARDGDDLFCVGTDGERGEPMTLSRPRLTMLTSSPAGAVASVSGADSYRRIANPDATARAALWVSDPATPNEPVMVARLTERLEIPRDLRWSADGTTLWMMTVTFPADSDAQVDAHTPYRYREGDGLVEIARYEGGCCYLIRPIGPSDGNRLYTHIIVGDGLGSHYGLTMTNLRNGRSTELDLFMNDHADSSNGPSGPAFADDGSSLLVTRGESRRLLQVSLPDLGRTRIAAIRSPKEIARSWSSPDGGHAIFLRLEGDGDDPRTGGPRAPTPVLVDASARRSSALVSLGRGWWSFVWAPDGRQVFGVRRDTRGAPAELGVLTIGSSSFTRWNDPLDHVLGWISL